MLFWIIHIDYFSSVLVLFWTPILYEFSLFTLVFIYGDWLNTCITNFIEDRNSSEKQQLWKLPIIEINNVWWWFNMKDKKVFLLFLGCFCVYNSTMTFDYLRVSLERTVLSDCSTGTHLSYQGLPIVIVYAFDSNQNEKSLLLLRDQGHALAER